MAARRSVTPAAKPKRSGESPRAVALPPIELASSSPGSATGGLPPAGHHLETVEGRRERHRRETFERLVRAAREIMFNRGFSDITVQDITDAADVGKGTFFNYFRSKEHIVTRVQEYNRRGLKRAVDELRSSERSPVEALTDILLWLLCPSGGDWLTYQGNTMRALALHADVRLYFSPELKSNLRVYEELIETAHRQGRIRTDLPTADLAMVTQTYIAGLTVLLWIHGISPTPALVGDLANKYFALIAPAATPDTTPRPRRRAHRARRDRPRSRAARRRRPRKR